MQQQSSPTETPSGWLLRSVRGATSVEVDTPEAHQAAVSALLLALVEANNIAPNDICTVFFTLTDDLHAISPAKVARQTAAKARHTGAQRHLKALLVGGNKVQRITRCAFHHYAVG